MLTSLTTSEGSRAYLFLCMHRMRQQVRCRAVVHRRLDDGVPPQCNGRLRKLFGKVGVVFKGSGFYRTDSREASKNSAKSSSNSSSSSESSSSAASSSSTEKVDLLRQVQLVEQFCRTGRRGFELTLSTAAETPADRESLGSLA